MSHDWSCHLARRYSTHPEAHGRIWTRKSPSERDSFSSSVVAMNCYAAQGTIAAQSMPFNILTETAGPIPAAPLSTLATQTACHLQDSSCSTSLHPMAQRHLCSCILVATCPASGFEHEEAVPLHAPSQVAVPAPESWCHLLPPLQQDAPPQLYEPALQQQQPFGRQGKGQGVLSLLARTCRRLLGRPPIGPEQEAEPAVPVSMLDDDLPALAWRQEVYVEARLQDQPDLSLGEARVRASHPCHSAGCPKVPDTLPWGALNHIPLPCRVGQAAVLAEFVMHVHRRSS
jgi:hypothetical protein